MTLNQRLTAFAQAVGVDIGELIVTRGDLTQLTTTAKNNLVAAINELKAGLNSVDLTAVINDAADVGVLTQTWSADKLVLALDQLKSDILNGAPESMNTLKEISDYLAQNDQNISGLLDLISRTVRYDASQTLTTAEQLQACANIDIGNPEVDLVAILTAQLPAAGNSWIVTDPFGMFTLKIEGNFQHDVVIKSPEVSDYPAYVDVAPNTTLTITLMSVDPAATPVYLSDYWTYSLQDTGTLAALDQNGQPMVLNTPYTVIVAAPQGSEGAIGFYGGVGPGYLRIRVVL